MTRGARAVATTRMFQRNVMAEKHIEDRPRLSIVLKRSLSRIELNDPFWITGFEKDM